MVVDTDGYLRNALLQPEAFSPEAHCHAPIIVRDETAKLGDVLQRFEVQPAYVGDNVIDQDVVLLWASERLVITGADILGRLLTGISRIR